MARPAVHQHLGRYQEIARVLADEGLGALALRLGLSLILARWRGKRPG